MAVFLTSDQIVGSDFPIFPKKEVGYYVREEIDVEGNSMDDFEIAGYIRISKELHPELKSNPETFYEPLYRKKAN